MDLEQWAERNDALIERGRARAAGLSDSQIDRRVASNRYRRVRQGVYVVNGAPPTWSQAVRAALIAAGPDMAGSHFTAERMLGGAEREIGEIHVLGPLGRYIRLQGVVAHQSGLLDDADVTTRHGMRCTSPLRTVIDLSGPLTGLQLGEVVDDFLRRKLLSLDALRERVAGLRAAPGRSPATLASVLAARIPGYDSGESPLEARILRAISSGGFSVPTQQHRVAFDTIRYRLDFAWPEQRVYLEGNGFGFHRLSSDLDRDARRQNLLVRAGWVPIEVTWSMTDAEIRAALDGIVPRRLR